MRQVETPWDRLLKCQVIISALISTWMEGFSPASGWKHVQFRLKGKVPSKKNRLTPRAGRGRKLRYNDETKAAMDALGFQVNQQCGAAPDIRKPIPCSKTILLARFATANDALDRDGQLTTLLDVLVRSGVLVDDSTLRFNGLCCLLPSEMSEDEGVDLDLYWTEQV